MRIGLGSKTCFKQGVSNDGHQQNPVDYAFAQQVSSGSAPKFTSLPRAAIAVLILSTALLLSFWGAPKAQAYVYWSNPNAGTIGRAENNSSAPNQAFITNAGVPRTVIVDSSHIYWKNGDASIGRANLDGTGADSNFVTGLSSVTGIVVDSLYIYWSSGASGTNSIGRANLDGTNVDNAFISGVADVVSPVGVAVDSTHVYWTNDIYEGTSFNTYLASADLDGTNVNPRLVNVTSATNPLGIAVNSSYFYWLNDSMASGVIGRANLDGTNPDPTFISTPSAPTGFAIDGTYVYWSTAAGSAIGRANLDGTSITPSFISGVNTPGGVAVDALFTPIPPAISVDTASYTFSAAMGTSVGSSATQEFTVTNSGTTDMVFGSPNSVSLVGNPDFSVVSDTCSGATLLPNDSCSVTVSFAPAAAGVETSVLQFVDDAADAPQAVELTGTGVIPLADNVTLSATSYDFGTAGVVVGSTATQSFTVTNNGTSILYLNNTYFVDGSAVLVDDVSLLDTTNFSIVSNTCSSAPVAPGESCVVAVAFTPTVVGVSTTTLQFVDNFASSPQTVILTGVGVAPSCDDPDEQGDISSHDHQGNSAWNNGLHVGDADDNCGHEDGNNHDRGDDNGDGHDRGDDNGDNHGRNNRDEGVRVGVQPNPQQLDDRHNHKTEPPQTIELKTPYSNAYGDQASSSRKEVRLSPTRR